MTHKGVTNAQLDHLKQMAKGKGVDREAFQKYGLDGGILATAMEAILKAGKPVVQAASSLLRLLTTVSVPAIEKFIAADHFKRDTSRSAKVTIGYLGDDFQRYFLPKIETNVPAAELAIHTLTKSSLDGPIRKELGTEREETTLAHLYELLSKQPKGEAGVLLTNGYANVFYIKDANGNLWAVHAGWDSFCGGWRVYADSVGDPREWLGGDRVVSQVGRT